MSTRNEAEMPIIAEDAPLGDYSVTKSQVAAMFGVSEKTVENWIVKGLIPAPRRIGRTVRFSRAEIDQASAPRQTVPA
jgi:excisionase family DNA binding protein